MTKKKRCLECKNMQKWGKGALKIQDSDAKIAQYVQLKNDVI